jgi:hypothetical protein
LEEDALLPLLRKIKWCRSGKGSEIAVKRGSSVCVP